MLQHFFVLSSWAITKWQDEEPAEESLFHAKDKEEFYARLTSQEKTALGFKVKRIIDMGRCLFLAEQGYQALIEEYCGIDLSPENLVIIIK